MLADFVHIITGNLIVIIFPPWLLENLEQLVTLSGIVSKTEVICWLSHDCVHYFYCFVAKVNIMWLCTLPFCRKHTIRHVSRFWHLPSWVGNTYDCPYFGTEGVLRLCLFPVLLWQLSVGGSETNRAWFSITFWDVTTMVALFSIF